MKSGLLSLALLPLVVLAQPVPPTVPPATRADPLDTLATDSPFLPGTGSGKAAATSTGPLEMRSVVFVDGAYRFSIYDQGTGESDWVGIGEKGFPFVVRSFNKERDELTVEHQGRSVVLGLQPARIASAANQPNPPGPVPLPTQGNPSNPTNRRNQSVPGGGPGNPPAANMPSSAEAQRLQNLADEIRRRRGIGSRITLPQSQPKQSNQPRNNRP